MAIFTFLGEGNYTVEGVIRYITISESGICSQRYVAAQATVLKGRWIAI